MKTTIVIPCFNASKYLRETLDSLKKQTIETKIIAIDDGSTDDTWKILQEYNITSVQQTHGGLGKAMNTGVKLCDTPYYIHLSADDLFTPTFIEQAEKMIESTGADVVIPTYEFFGQQEGLWNLPGFSDWIKVNNTVFFSSLTRKSLWEKVGGFEEHMPYSGIEDWEFWIRAHEAGATSVQLDLVGVKYRMHDTNMTKTTAAPHMDVLGAWMKEHGRTA